MKRIKVVIFLSFIIISIFSSNVVNAVTKNYRNEEVYTSLEEVRNNACNGYLSTANGATCQRVDLDIEGNCYVTGFANISLCSAKKPASRTSSTNVDSLKDIACQDIPTYGTYYYSVFYGCSGAEDPGKKCYNDYMWDSVVCDYRATNTRFHCETTQDPVCQPTTSTNQTITPQKDDSSQKTYSAEEKLYASGVCGNSSSDCYDKLLSCFVRYVYWEVPDCIADTLQKQFNELCQDDTKNCIKYYQQCIPTKNLSTCTREYPSRPGGAQQGQQGGATGTGSGQGATSQQATQQTSQQSSQQASQPAKKTTVETQAVAQINGQTDVTVSADTPYIDIGGRVYLNKDSLQCAPDQKISLQLIKVKDENGKDINQVIKDIPKADNCQSYSKTPLAGAGSYVLNLKFTPADTSIYKAVSTSTKLTVTKSAKTATKSSLEVKLKSQDSDPTFDFSPKTTFNDKCDAKNIGFVEVISSFGGVRSEPVKLENCTTTSKRLSDFYPGKQPSDKAISFQSMYLGTNESPFQPSFSDVVTMNLSSGQIAAKSDQTTTPTDKKPSISTENNPGESSWTILYGNSTTEAKAPRFIVSIDGQKLEALEPQGQSLGCKNGQGSCTYFYTLSQLNGSYEVKFCTDNEDNCSDSTKFSTRQALTDDNSGDSIKVNGKEIAGYALKIRGETVDLAQGLQTSLTFGENENEVVAQVLVHFTDGSYSETGKTVKFRYSPEEAQQENGNSGSGERQGKYASRECVYTEGDSCHRGNCLDPNQKCSYNVNCGYVPGLSSGEKVACEDNPQSDNRSSSKSSCNNPVFQGCDYSQCGIEVYKCEDGSSSNKQNMDGNCGKRQFNKTCSEDSGNQSQGQKCEDTKYTDPNANPDQYPDQCVHKYAPDKQYDCSDSDYIFAPC